MSQGDEHVPPTASGTHRHRLHACDGPQIHPLKDPRRPCPTDFLRHLCPSTCPHWSGWHEPHRGLPACPAAGPSSPSSQRATARAGRSALSHADAQVHQPVARPPAPRADRSTRARAFATAAQSALPQPPHARRPPAGSVAWAAGVG
eukprot:scaffold110534_cov34-Tisochrysis_lutea.AAC.1